MVQANMLEAKTDLSKFVRMLESGEQDVVYIARNNVPVVQMTVIKFPGETQRIGVAKGKFSVPDDFDDWDAEVSELFEVGR
ncbi:MAG: hypothetical protein Q3963_04485 [Coriobacteriaceae bacterium]|jgi:antitoxin (DNA-binding transcriptional repressor) of toxin-antitoxin stability system|nr:toxin-antitoxin system, antitoxin component, PHD family protein [Coriobacteriaceae bacterium]MDO4890597.1 hypothetical protein [Coriobacteriaceae bacterium]